jgi:hypothetical protein
MNELGAINIRKRQATIASSAKFLSPDQFSVQSGKKAVPYCGASEVKI